MNWNLMPRLMQSAMAETALQREKAQSQSWTVAVGDADHKPVRLPGNAWGPQAACSFSWGPQNDKPGRAA